MKKTKNIYNLSAEEILRKFQSDSDGLKDKEAELRLKQYGLNKIEKKQNWKWARLIFNQFNDALVWILLVAAGLALIFGEFRDVTIIMVIVFINSLIGFFQEFKAERILDSLKKLATDKALVVRKGIKKEINSKFIVPGDIIFISAGDNIPADGYLLESYSLRVSSFAFTGESRPETKKAGRMGGLKTKKRGKTYYQNLQKLSIMSKQKKRELVLKSVTIEEIGNPVTLKSVQDKLEQIDNS